MMFCQPRQSLSGYNTSSIKMYHAVSLGEKEEKREEKNYIFLCLIDKLGTKFSKSMILG